MTIIVAVRLRCQGREKRPVVHMWTLSGKPRPRLAGGACSAWSIRPSHTGIAIALISSGMSSSICDRGTSHVVKQYYAGGECMPARTGAAYLQGLRARNTEVWLGHERIRDVTTHPALRRCARSVAHLYDMQYDPVLRDEMTYISPTSGQRVGLSFITPQSLEDLQRRSRMMLQWARYSGGMLGRSPDYLNVSLMAAAAAAEFYGQNDPRFADNARNYYTYVRENDLCLTHTLVNPQANRALTATGHPSAEIAARIVKETDKGIVIRGARILATLGPLSDEIMVFPSTVLKAAADTASFAFAFAIPCDTPGLKFICREGFDYGYPHFDHPLGSRFEEMDAIVVFDDVVVPWERVFLKADPFLCNQLFAATNAVVHLMHQVVV